VLAVLKAERIFLLLSDRRVIIVALFQDLAL